MIRNTIPLDAKRLYELIRRTTLSFVEIVDEDFESFSDENSMISSSTQISASSMISSSVQSSARIGDDVSVDLINAKAVDELKEIADQMLRSGYEEEFVQAYSSVRRDALDYECLAILGIGKLSIEEVEKNIEWESLEGKMREWIQAVKIVRDIVSREKSLCDHIFHDADGIKEICFKEIYFNEIGIGCVMQLLNFGEVVAIGRRSPEKLFRILDMYHVMAHALPDLEAMVTDEFVINKAKGVLCGLGEAASGTFVEFKNAVESERLRIPMQSGDIQPLTRYVINYLKLLVEYKDTLKLLLESGEDDGFDALQNDNDNDHNDNSKLSPVARWLLLAISSLQSNLEAKSKLCKDNALQYIFLMNNFLYVVQKVKDSDLGEVLGDYWVRKRRGQIRQYATSYLRASWSKALSCLKDEGIGGSTSNASKVALKERFKNFNTCFEEIYRTQTAWKVPDAELREDLRISISELVIPAYRSFLGRFGNRVESGRYAGKYIKYSADDLQSYLLDLFEGSPRVPNHMRKKSK
jgi:exocyst complex protein 7